MSQHPNARLTPRGRELLASRIAGGERVSAVARQMGVSRQTASKWLSRAGGAERRAKTGDKPLVIADVVINERLLSNARRAFPLCTPSYGGGAAHTCRIDGNLSVSTRVAGAVGPFGAR